MRYRRRSLAVRVAIFCAVSVAGCGGGATAQFKAGFSAAQRPLNRTFADVATTFSQARGKSVKGIARSLDALDVRFRKQLAPLEALKAPPAVAASFRTLTSSLKRVEGDLRAISAAVKHRDLLAAHQALGSLQSDAGAATNAAGTVAKKLDHK
ncbi:MAG TPA: hypothetical protein VG294_20120 [Solirubrobacteraceae bacterium]|jgi:hypothetical protein|nr:hypothetical protein [Solirubrobacteraceae bacterium]